MKKIVVIDGHPDPAPDRLNHALANRYAREAEAAGASVRRIDLARLDVPQDDIAWADHVVVFYPLWMFSVPALLSAFKFKGIWRVRATLIGSVANPDEKTHDRWFERIAKIARCDAERRAHPLSRALIAGAAFGAGVAGAYAASALITWSSYGRPKRSGAFDELLDRVMPDYEVRIAHHIEIEAPADLAFAAICRSDFSRSPMVRALFRAREIVMHAKHGTADTPGARGLVRQFTELGWSVVGQVEHREIAFGTATKPWEPNPVMLALTPERFSSFAEPDYARIAFNVRVDPLSPSRCIARTETRVQTTDERSRAKFRRYWSFLSPGIALVRLTLLQQMKSEAEASWRALRIGV